MRVLIAGLLIIGGGLAALALIWMFYTTSDPKSSSTISVVTNEEIEVHKENTAKVQTDTTEGKPESASTQSDRENQAWFSRSDCVEADSGFPSVVSV